MLRIFLLLLAVALPTLPASAADLPARPRLANPMADVGWSGFYLGLDVGQNLGAFSPFCRACGPTGTEVNLDDNSWMFGGHMGYLIQPAGGIIVFGAEIGIQNWSQKAKSDTPPIVVLPATLITNGLQTKVDWAAYVNARIGITPFPNTLIYLTGGPAWAHVKTDVSALINLNNLDTSNEQSLFGLNIGGGVEFKVGEYFVFGGEYKHYDFGKVAAANPTFNLMGIGSSDRLTVDQAVFRLSYRVH